MLREQALRTRAALREERDDSCSLCASATFVSMLQHAALRLQHHVLCCTMLHDVATCRAEERRRQQQRRAKASTLMHSSPDPGGRKGGKKERNRNRSGVSERSGAQTGASTGCMRTRERAFVWVVRLVPSSNR